MKNRLTYLRYSLTLLLLFLLTMTATGENTSMKNIKVGFFTLDGYHNIDEKGVKSGYGYDFLALMKRYADVNYEYIGYGKSRFEVMQMLEEGKVDIVTGIHKSADLTEKFDFSLPIGLNSAQIRSRQDDDRYSLDDVKSLDGALLGFVKSSLMVNKIGEFARVNGFRYKSKFYDSYDDLGEALQRGEVDAATSNSLRRMHNEKLIDDFDSEHFYVIVRKGESELLNIINAAIRQMNVSEIDWKGKLYLNNYEMRKYDRDLHFTTEEKAFIEAHSQGGKKLVIAYDNSWAPFSSKQDGKYIGIMHDYWNLILQMTGMESVVYDSKTDIIDDNVLLQGKADIYLGYCFDASISETNGFVESSPLMEVGACYLSLVGTKEIKKIGVSHTNLRLNANLQLNKGQKMVEYPTTNDAVEALKKGEVDELFLYDYEGELALNKDHSGMLQHIVVPNVSLQLCAITPESNSHTLIGIVSKCINNITVPEVNTIVAHNLSIDSSTLTLMDYVKLHPIAFATAAFVLISMIFVIIVSLMRRRISRKHHQELETRLEIIQSMTKVYLSTAYIDMHDDSYILFTSNAKIDESIPTANGAQDALNATCRDLVLPEYQESIYEFLDLSTVNERMKGRNVIATKFCGNNVGWTMSYIIAGDRDENGNLNHVFFATREVNEEQHKEEAYIKQLQDAKAEAEAASQAKTSFLFNMSHDIRTPMNAIIGFRDLLEMHQDDPEKRADYLRKMEESNHVLLSIINNVLEMSRIEKGTLEIDESPWSTEELVDMVCSIFNDMMKEKNITFTHDMEVEHVNIYCDLTKIREIFLNLLSNAYKYTHEGGSVSLSLKELPYDRDGWMLYQTTISDTGIGMSEDFLPHIFDEFSRERNTTEGKIEGTGLGMPIVKRLVELMDGTIEVKSKKGEGTTFIVSIPHRIAETANHAERLVDKDDASQLKGCRILLVEDNDFNAEIATVILEEEGFVIERAQDGQVCCDMLTAAPAGHYDAILMDIQMPVMNGYEATKAIRQMDDPAKANIPILAMTANAFDEDRREALRVGMNGHLSKPISIHLLIRELTKVLGGDAK